MKIFDCFMFYDEKLLLDIRMNILNEFVDYFVIVESKYYHNGIERELIFDINDYKKFKDKIIYIVHDEIPSILKDVNSNDYKEIKTYKLNFNAHVRENDHRNKIMAGLKNADNNDLILISDVDEIPKLDKTNFTNIKNKIIIFEQNIFYYKLNRYLPNYTWYGTKACKKKDLVNPQWLRNTKNNKYSFFRLDTFFSKKKYIDKLFIGDGGWHFSNLKSAFDIELKLKSYLHYTDYKFEELGKNKIENLIKSNKTIYDMFGDKSSKKFSDDKRKDLEIYQTHELPKYIQNNLEKYKDWMD